MAWLAFLRLALEIVTKAPAAIGAIRDLVDLMERAKWFDRWAMRDEAVEALKVATARASMARPRAVSSLQESCIADLRQLCTKWERQRGGRGDLL